MSRALILIALAVVLGVPFAVRPRSAVIPTDAERVVIISPHIEPIRTEFSQAFEKWHQKKFGKPAVIDWRVIGGATEIRKQLETVYSSAIRTGQLLPSGELAPGVSPMPYDILFGGGHYDLEQVKKGVTARPPPRDEDTKPVTLSMSIPAGFTQAQMDEWFGENAIGTGRIYDPGDASKGDPGQYWIGTAFSGFGIVFNRDVLRRFGLPDPVRWEDMCRPELVGWIAMADPRQSGSVATLYDSILNNYGWEKGWRTLREMSANARYFTNSSPKVPIDVSAGEAAMGVAISHYGRYQAQMMQRAGETPETARVGYIDPPGLVYIDADSISILRGGANPTVAKRFVEFCISEDGQALWQFPALEGTAGIAGDGMGPERFELRRMPVRRVMYEKYADRMMDKVNPFEIVSKTQERGWRSSIGGMMGAFAIDIDADIKRAWWALAAARARKAPNLKEMEEAFFAFPEWEIPAKDGAPSKRLAFTEANFKEIAADWKRAEKDGRWAEIKASWVRFFRGQYLRVEELGRAG